MDFKEIEKRWQSYWEDHPEMFRASDDSLKEKFYVLVEFPYPSGSGLHVGHAFSFTGADVYARFKRMQGYNVLFPMGWDAFGLPTENYAIKMKRRPQEVTSENTDMFRSQMKKLAFSFDWEREVNTTDPEYYKWTQWIFVQLYKKGLAYKQEMPINWCPSCKIGLANEEVISGKCERCGAEVSRRNISQWVVKITDYADKLIDGLEDTKFIEKVKQAQINWIDRKEWIDITYPIEGTGEVITVATTRPDTNFGATFVVLAPEHEIVSKLLSGEVKTGEDLEKIKEYVIKAKSKSELDRQKEVAGRNKTGIFSGLYAINQLTGKKMPLWITDFVLSSVGTGAVVGVPGHDKRDFEFAQQFGLEVVRVVVGKNGETDEIKNLSQVQEEEGRMINSGFLDGMEIHEATKKIMNYLEKKRWGKKSVRYHLRDWIFSRQHYWGEPIPMINCSKCGWQPVPEEKLPVVLPEVQAYEPTDDGQSPLSKIEKFVNCECPKCGGEARRETDTMPNWAGSDWYFLRYLDPNNKKEIVDKELVKKWMPVDFYIGGDEHNTLHLLYSRFIYKFLIDIGAIPKEIPEPYIVRISHGVILGSDNQRMSKSKGNVIVPEVVADKYGVDVVRMYLMFIGPFDGVIAWNENTLMGVKRFIDRLSLSFNMINKLCGKSSEEVKAVMNLTIRKVTDDINHFKFNTAIASLMELLNSIQTIASDKAWYEVLDIDSYKELTLMLAPVTPYIAEEMWDQIGGVGGDAKSVHEAVWPVVNDRYISNRILEIPVAINGKKKLVVEVPIDVAADRDRLIEIIKSNKKVSDLLENRVVIKEVIVPCKMVNFVV